MVSGERTGTKSSPPIFALPIALAVLAIAGCGGHSGATASSQKSRPAGTTASTRSSSAPGTGSTAGFVAKADAICRRVNAELAAGGVRRGKRVALGTIGRMASRNAAIERKGLARLESLAVPGAISVVWQRVLADRTALSRQLTELAEVVPRKDASAIKALGTTKKRLHADLSKAAKQGGFEDCGKLG